MKLRDVRIVDLRTSVIDKALSKPEQAQYVFKSKQYISYRGKGPRPDYWFKWILHDKNHSYREEHEAMMRGYTYVVSGVDPYWPETVPPNGDGQYVYCGDVVLMKQPLLKYLDERLENAKLSKGLSQAAITAFESELRDGGAELSQKLIDQLAGK
jgi:glycosyltransferase involved in cell wall biosynthesis